ncbi:hypothetical protein [Jannaschia sp. LMIT008]|uniref:hypothetical protein n=1 Tax=Jannaschia maritima TaxID=3032585 RepID=UPI002811F2F1|nr:hypothetical protein [Jannaschia sp. LMIT008]
MRTILTTIVATLVLSNATGAQTAAPERIQADAATMTSHGHAGNRMERGNDFVRDTPGG